MLIEVKQNKITSCSKVTIPDLDIDDKEKRICQIVEFAIPYDTKIMENGIDKIIKYQDLARK